jgi:hypothetical protein
VLAFRRIAVIFGLLLGAVVLSPSARASSPPATTTDFCGVLGVDPDSVTATSPVVGPQPGLPAVGTVTASETPQEAGPNAPTVRLRVYIHGDNALGDLLAESTGPFTKGSVSLSGPSTGKFLTRETIGFTAPGTYTFDFQVLFDNGLHPCTSLGGLNPTLTITVPQTAQP